MTRAVPASLRRPSPVVIGLGFVVSLSGHFTLDRIGITVPLVNDARIILFWLLLVAFQFEVTGARGALRREPRARCLYPILGLFAFQAASTLWSPNDAELAGPLGDLVSITLLVIVWWTLAAWDRDRVVRLTFRCFLAAALVYFLFAASGRGHDASGRWAALGGGPNVFVRVMVIGSIAAVYFYCRSGRIAWLLPVPVLAAGALLSGSRGGLFSAALVLMVCTVPRLARFGARRSISAMMAAIVLGGFTWAVAGRQLWSSIQERFVVETYQKQYTSDRDVLFREAFAMFRDRPIGGVGLDGFRTITTSGELYVHCLPLAVAAEGGLIGLLLLLLALYASGAAYAAVPSDQRTLESRAAMYCALFVFIAGLFSGSYYDARLMWIFLILAAVQPHRRCGDDAVRPAVPVSRAAAGGTAPNRAGMVRPGTREMDC